MCFFVLSSWKMILASMSTSCTRRKAQVREPAMRATLVDGAHLCGRTGDAHASLL